jgi:predicted Zn finger-like uncharacterized protein
MRKVNCEACGAAYEVDPRRIPPNGMKMRCSACGASVHVAPEAAARPTLTKGSSADLELDLPAPKPPKAGGAATGGLPAPSLPPVKLPGLPAKGLAPKGAEHDLSDLPAVRPRATPTRPAVPAALSATAADDLADLPAPKSHLKPGPKPLAPSFHEEPSGNVHPALKKTAPAGLSPVTLGDGDFELDLPAPKPQPDAAPRGAAKVELDPPARKPPNAAPKLDLQPPATKPYAPIPRLELDPPSAKVKPVAPELDLAPHKPRAADEKPQTQGATGKLDPDLPANKARPQAPAFHPDLPANKARPQAPGFHPDLPANKARPQAPDFHPDLPANKARPSPGAPLGQAAAPPRATAPHDASAHGTGRPEIELGDAPLDPGALDIDLPSPKSRTAPHADLPAAKAKSPASPARFEQRAPEGLSLDSPLDRREASAPTPKKSFAKPSAASPNVKPQPSLPSDDGGGASGGMLPKDSLALEQPRPFFASAPPLGMFGKLDDLGGPKEGGANGLVDLPAPNDLPAVKRPVAKPTALGLGGHLPKDSLDLPAEFGAGASLPDVLGEPPRAPEQNQPFASEDTAARLLSGFSELDLPAPRDLPAVKKRPAPKATALGLGNPIALAPKGNYEVQLLNGTAAAAGAREPELSLDLPPMSPREGPRPEIDLGEFERALDNLESKGPGTFGGFSAELDLPRRDPEKHGGGTFGDLEPIALPSAGVSNTMALSTMELAPGDMLLTGTGGGLEQAGGRGLARHGELGLELDGMADLSAPPGAGGGGASFGELDLGLGRESQVGLPLAIPTRRAQEAAKGHAANIEDADLIDPQDDAYEAHGKRRRKAGRSLPGWVIPVALVGAIGSAGAALGLFTEHGWFGVYLMEQLLPAAGNAEQVRTALEQAERQARSDTYVDVRRSLVTLSDARNEAGLNRELLARSLLHEALYQLRFGEDEHSAQRSVAITARVLERGTQVPGLALARAADAGRRGELAEARRLLAQAERDDRYYGLVDGELALLEKQPEAAAKAFREAVGKGEVARGQWGLARAQLAANKLGEAEVAAKATLAVSPRHSPAHSLLAQQALARGALDAALSHVRAAAGALPIDGTPAKPSRAERSRAFAIEGRIEEKRDHPREAQAAYEHALAGAPQSVPELLGSGRMLMRLGRPQDALSRFDSALHAKPSPSVGADGRIPMLDAGLGAVQAMLALQRPQEALARSTALLAQYATEPEVKLWHGYALEALERHDDAEASFRETIERAPKLFSGYVALSQLLFKRGRPEEAARVLSRATGQVDDSAEVRRMLGHSELTRQHLPEAVHQFEAALHFDPNDAGALFGLAVAQRKSGAMDAASATIDRLEKADPTFPGLALERGQIMENRGAYGDAIALYKKALAQRPNDSELKLRLGAALVTAGEVDEAEGVLDQVLKERPTSAEAEHYLGRVLFARKETAQAAQRFERAVNFDTLKPEYHMYLAWALLDQGNFGGALQSVQRSIERDPNSGDARWILGRIQLRTGAVKDALLNFQTALRLKPGRVEALAEMGEAYDELRDLTQAIESYKEALKRAPDNAEWWYRLGQLHLDKGHRDDARVALAEAVMRGDKLRDRPSWLADAHRTYGDVLRESKRGAEASDHYRLFLELAPLGHPDRAEIQNLLFQTKR